MTLSVGFAVWLLFLHWVGDFVLQSDEMAVQKSKQWRVLAAHVGIVAVILLLGVVWAAPWPTVLAFVGANALGHFVTDAVTSRMTSALWFIPLFERTHAEIQASYGGYTHLAYVRPTRHNFFVTIGFDQWVHGTTLLVTAGWYL